MKLKNRTLLTLGLLFGSAGAGHCLEVTDWYPVTTENRPFVRWWWLGSAVDPEGLTYNLEEFASKGLGGVEITPIYGVKGNEANDIDYLSPRWMQMLGHTIAEGNRLGLQIDMNNGTGWPFGGPEVTTDHSARKRVAESWTVSPGKKLKERIRPSDKKQQGVATLQRIIAVNGDRRIDITRKLGRDSLLNWKAPKGKGEWTVYAIFSGRTFQKVKRAAPGGEGLVVNHYDSTAINSYLDRFDRAFDSSGAPTPNTFFNDSYEVYGSDWADNIFEEFERDHGYKLELYLPEFLDQENHTDLRSRVVRDYRATLARMLRENFTDVWMARSHRRGARVRNQSHGSPANIIDLYAAVDIPECESFGQTDFTIPGLVQDGPSRPSDSDPAVLKFASSAAHVSGKKLTSAETLTWLTEHFRTTLARCKPELDQMFCSGVNHVYFHGAPYSPKGAAFPGYMFYASINMSPTNSIWRDADALFSYITRCQSFLSAGVPDNDVLLYFPIEDVWHRQGGNPYLMFDIHKMQQRMPDIKQHVTDIMAAGYDPDYISDALTSTLTVDGDGRLKGEGEASYGAIVVSSVRYMHPSTLAKIISLAKEGATVIITGSIPKDVPGLSRRNQRADSLNALVSELPAIGQTPCVHSEGKGRIITAPDIAQALAISGLRPETLRSEQNISMIRRRNEAGGYNYFLANLKGKAIDGKVTLATPSKGVEIFDPLTGESGLAQCYESEEGTTALRLQLQPGQSLLLKTFAEKPELKEWGYIESTGTPITLDRGWKLAFEKSEPAIEGTFNTDILTAWTNLPAEDAKINFGTGVYTVEFTLDDPSEASDWVLDLGDVRHSAEVTINGQDAGKVWSAPFNLRVGRFLKPGLNRLEVRVTNNQANRIADYERRGVKWRVFKDANIASVTNAKTFSFGDWEEVPAGLNSTVRLIPVEISNQK